MVFRIVPFRFYTFSLFSFEGILAFRISGDNRKGVTPVPIPNTEVKPFSAEDTWWEATWENRTLPVK
jgi:hypothetical protein